MILLSLRETLNYFNSRNEKCYESRKTHTLHTNTHTHDTQHTHTQDIHTLQDHAHTLQHKSNK